MKNKCWRWYECANTVKQHKHTDLLSINRLKVLTASKAAEPANNTYFIHPADYT